jgi:AraC-like DNA-binding protein
MKQVFEKEHIHLESKLTIQDVALKVGTNRTYISSLINQHYGVNFCSFVNNLRVEEMERMMKENPKATNQMLAEACGFGSVDSLKRAVQSKTGLSISAWKRQHTSAEITGQETR